MDSEAVNELIGAIETAFPRAPPPNYNREFYSELDSMLTQEQRHCIRRFAHVYPEIQPNDIYRTQELIV